MAQVQPRETGSVQKGLRFPVRLVILLLVVAGAVTLYVARTEKEEPFSVLVHVAGDEAKIVQTVGGTVESVLAEAGIQVGPHDVVTPSLSEYVGPDTEIEIVRAVPIRVTVDAAKRSTGSLRQPLRRRSASSAEKGCVTPKRRTSRPIVQVVG